MRRPPVSQWQPGRTEEGGGSLRATRLPVRLTMMIRCGRERREGRLRFMEQKFRHWERRTWGPYPSMKGGHSFFVDIASNTKALLRSFDLYDNLYTPSNIPLRLLCSSVLSSWWVVFRLVASHRPPNVICIFSAFFTGESSRLAVMGHVTAACALRRRSCTGSMDDSFATWPG
jgi:hypothetical protein